MKNNMWAVGFKKHLPIEDEQSLVEFTMPIPKPKGQDLLVEVQAVSVNPVDTATRSQGTEQYKQPKVIGWDAVGTVVDKGPDVHLFEIGDRVFYAGSYKRPGSNSEYQLVDERIVGHAPQKLDNAHAAAIPLTALTAWEALFEQLGIDPKNQVENTGKSILIINGAGGVGSVATQLAHWAGLKVIASASRPETIDWCLNHGADLTVSHRLDLIEEVHQIGYEYVDYIMDLNNLDANWKAMSELIAPNGHMVSITRSKQPLDLQAIKSKRVSFAWEWMYTKSFYETDDMISQHDILEKIAQMLDQGELVSTLNRQLSSINADTLKQAHSMIESHKMIGKLVLTKSKG